VAAPGVSVSPGYDVRGVPVRRGGHMLDKSSYSAILFLIERDTVEELEALI
jgi:hypothetical protein